MENKFIKEIVEPEDKAGKSYWFIFRGNDLLVEIKEENQCGIPLLEDLSSLRIEPLRMQYIGRYNGKRCYSAEVSEQVKPPGNMVFQNLRRLYDRIDFDLFLAAGYAIQIVNWDQTFQYCGRCGSKTVDMEEERAKICPKCELINYPRISPSMITAVIKDRQILLARSARFKRGFYSVLAGFVEPGETLEQCVKREVKEEVNIQVKNIRYFGSQPWPFPHSLMIGFIADYAGGEIAIDNNEIVDAGWFSPGNLPEVPPKLSIARQLIDWFVENYK